TKMIYDAACAFLGVAPTWTPRASLPPAPGAIVVDRGDDGVLAALQAVAAGYDVADDDAALRAFGDGAAFRKYREDYPERRELDGRAVRFARPLTDAIRMLNAYGARVEPL
ncbi:MAG TPA: DUF3410 domain-containing protein, partial [Polyangia bacterium]